MKTNVTRKKFNEAKNGDRIWCSKHNERNIATMKNVRKKKLKMTFSDVGWIELQMFRKVEVK